MVTGLQIAQKEMELEFQVVNALNVMKKVISLENVLIQEENIRDQDLDQVEVAEVEVDQEGIQEKDEIVEEITKEGNIIIKKKKYIFE